MRTIQSNMTSGELSPALKSRIDSEVYYNGVQYAQNVVIMPHGGLRRRPGLSKAQDSLTEDGRMFSFEFSTFQDYLIMFVPGIIKVYRDGVLQATLDTQMTLDQIKEMDFIQSGDVCIITHVEHKPKMLRRLGSDALWEFVDAPLSGIPDYDFGQGDEPVWSETRGWPGVCTFFQQRLWFAGSKHKPNSVWGSKINSYYEFDIGTGQPDYGVFDTIDTEQFNRIINIYAGRNLQVFTTGAEFYNTAEYITTETSAWKRATSYGSKRVQPESISGGTLFVDKLGRNIRSAEFHYQVDSYVADTISALSEHLIKDVQRIAAVKGTNIDISDFLYVINRDGSLAVMNKSNISDSYGWTHWTTKGYFRDVCVVNKVVYFLVERHGEYHIEFMNEGTTTDHNTVHWGAQEESQNVIKDVENVIHKDQNVVQRIQGTGSPITEIDTEETPAQAGYLHVLKLDNRIQPPTKGGLIVFDRPAYQIEVGFDVPVRVKTMPISVQAQDGETRTQTKRIKKVNLIVADTLGISANTEDSPDRIFPIVLDSGPDPISGLKSVSLLGYTKETTLEIHQDNPLPMKLLGIGFEIV